MLIFLVEVISLEVPLLVALKFHFFLGFIATGFDVVSTWDIVYFC